MGVLSKLSRATQLLVNFYVAAFFLMIISFCFPGPAHPPIPALLGLGLREDAFGIEV